MIAKLLEIRDRNTFIPALAVSMLPERMLVTWETQAMAKTAEEQFAAQRYLLRRAGYAEAAAIGPSATSTPGATGPTGVAHDYIEKHWHDLKDGDVVCVETILGERATPKVSERLEHPL